jgi:hypothetical protein
MDQAYAVRILDALHGGAVSTRVHNGIDILPMID